MIEDEDGRPPPRHRKQGRARKRGANPTGRHLRAVAEAENASPAPAGWCDCPPGYHEYGAHAPGARVPRRSEVPVPPGAYPVEDLAGMSTSAAALLLRRAVIEAETDAAECPHLLITRDCATGVVTYSGPFTNGLEALQRAQDFVDKYRDLDPRWDFTLTVAPLFPS